MVVTAEPGLAPDSVSSTLPADGIERRAVDALLRCIARHGLGKTTLDDVAREAGCARATLYRYFAASASSSATLAAESLRIAAAIEAGARAPTDLEDAVVAILGTATRELARARGAPVPPRPRARAGAAPVTFAAGDRFLAVAGAALAPVLEPHVGPERAPRAGEWVARLVLSYCAVPTDPIDLTDDSECTRRLPRVRAARPRRPFLPNQRTDQGVVPWPWRPTTR